jgi:hypothetical protein
MANYIFSQSSDGRTGKSKGSYFIIGRVKSIVLGPENYDGSINTDYSGPSDIGKITYEILYTNINLSFAEKVTQPAHPIFSFIKQFPLISEIVFIVPGPDSNLNDSSENQGYYYFPAYNTWNTVNHNAFPNLPEYSQFIKDYYTLPTLEGSNNDKDAPPSLPLGYEFFENSKIKTLRVFEGDSIIESRFGQSIRFGSTNASSKNLNSWSSGGNAGDPITIIRNGQGKNVSPDNFKTITEDLNLDNSSIYLTSGQIININNLDRFPLQSFGVQIAINNNQSAPIYKETQGLNSKYSSSPATQDKQIMS